MFETDPLHERGKALEDEFFHSVDQKLRAQLRETMDREKARERLCAATGFKDKKLIDHLLDAGFEATTLAALALVPSVFVAWADGSVTHEERQTVMGAALHRGMDRQPSSFHLIESWLSKKPPKSLWNLWKEYTQAIYESLSPAMRKVLAAEIEHQAKTVAEASRQTFALGRISSSEQAILDEIASISS